MKFSGICLTTKDVTALADFYTKVLEVEAEGDATHVELHTKGGGIAIFSAAGMESMAPRSTQGIGYGGVILTFEVEDVDAAYERLKLLDVEFIKLPETHPWGARSVWFKDPDGNIVDFFSTVKNAFKEQ